ncbi:CHAT domain-containing protein, partial [Leptodontidium sp. MPI-SDFR-AT-0119]
LWTSIVKPVLDATRLTESRRVWWITTGLAGRAPLHAAGNHSAGSTENTGSNVVSYYISSFKALRYARQRRNREAPRRNMLLVTMQSNPTPHKDLDTRYEEEVFGPFLTHLPQPSPSVVLDSLPHYSFVHFACHGFSLVNNPAANGLLLVDHGQAAILSISALEKVDLKDSAIAYLSACSTAEQSNLKLADEAIYLANSFQALGFQHVIGTLWGADDTAAGEVARRFYEKLCKEKLDKAMGRKVIGRQLGTEVGHALHEAVTEYKKTLDGAKDVLKWAPFIHIGI